MGVGKLKSDVQAIARIAGDDSPRPAIPAHGVPHQGNYSLRGRWTADEYTRMRNAAWAVRNSRRANTLNPVAVQLVVQEAEKLHAQGEPLFDIFEAFIELLRVP